MNGEHLSPKTRELLDKPIEERIAHIQKDSWIPYSQANKILQQLEDLLQHPKCDRMPNLAISAQTNNGKTRLMKHFLSLHQARETSSGTIAAPVFYVQSPSIPEESRLYSAILLKLCKKFRPSAPPQEKLVLVLDALSKIEIRILALDEVNFTEVGTAAKQKRFLNALRYLANELRISIVCLGTEEMMRVIRSVSSVENRFPPTILPRWRTDDEFRQLLASFEKIIPLKYPSDLQGSTTLTAKLLTRSEGTIGELKMLLAAVATERSASPKRSLPHATMCLRPHESSDQFPADALRYRAPSRSSARFVIPTRKSSPSPGGLWSFVDIPVVALLAPSRASKRT